jgi:hypothetical protein
MNTAILNPQETQHTSAMSALDIMMNETVMVRIESMAARMATSKITKERYAVVGTYSLTSKSLNLFIKLIDIRTGNILSSSYERTDIDSEILDLEGEKQNLSDDKKQPSGSYRPHVVL